MAPKVLVIGASRGIGRATVERALEAGYQVRGFARDASVLDDHPQLERVSGDALDAQAVKAALDGCDWVVQALGVPFNWQLITGPITSFSTATEILLQQMAQCSPAGPRRLVAVTGYGAGSSAASIHWLQRPGFNFVFGRAYADKSVQESMIEASDLDWTIVRPGVLTHGPQQDDYLVLEQAEDWVNGVIARASVADFIIQSLAGDDYIHRAPVLVRDRLF